MRSCPCYYDRFYYLKLITNRYLEFFLILAFILSLSVLCDSEAQARTKPVYKGSASWYGTTAHGKKTANGETFLKNKFSAAHKTIPFGTVVRVVNPNNDKEVLVRVNDRGPFIKGRVIDLSKRAANNLDMIQSGVARVEFIPVTDIEGRPLNPKNAFFIRLEEAEDVQKAHKLTGDIKKAVKQPIRIIKNAAASSISLCIGPFESFQEAEKSVRKLDKSYAVLDIIEAPAMGQRLPFFAKSHALGSTAASLSSIDAPTIDLRN